MLTMDTIHMAYLNYIHDMLPPGFPILFQSPQPPGSPSVRPAKKHAVSTLAKVPCLLTFVESVAVGFLKCWCFLWWNPLFILCFLIGHIEFFSCLCNVRWGVAISHKTSFKGSQGELSRLMQRQPTMLELHYQLKQHFRLFWCNVNTGLINPPPPL